MLGWCMMIHSRSVWTGAKWRETEWKMKWTSWGENKSQLPFRLLENHRCTFVLISLAHGFPLCGWKRIRFPWQGTKQVFFPFLSGWVPEQVALFSNQPPHHGFMGCEWVSKHNTSPTLKICTHPLCFVSKKRVIYLVSKISLIQQKLIRF